MLGKQSKVLTKPQIDRMLNHLSLTRMSTRNQVIFLLSCKGGLRSKEISQVEWNMVVDPDGEIIDCINLLDRVSKGNSGRVIPLHRDLKDKLIKLYEIEKVHNKHFDINTSKIVRTERSLTTSPQSIVNLFQRWYLDMGYIGCSSHSGRRTFITNLSKKLSLVGGSLRDIQGLVGHKNLQTTQRYIDIDTDCQRELVKLL
jgi:integrase/recombinase XerD